MGRFPRAQMAIMKVKMSVAQSGLTLCDPRGCACQAPLSMGFSRPENRGGCHSLHMVSSTIKTLPYASLKHRLCSWKAGHIPSCPSHPF